MLVFTSTYGPTLIEMHWTWILLRYVRMFVEGFIPPESTQVQRSDMVYGWMTVVLRNNAGVVSAPLSNVLIVVRECQVSLFFVLFMAIALSISHQLRLCGGERRGNSDCRMVDFHVGCGLLFLGLGYSLDLQTCESAGLNSLP